MRIIRVANSMLITGMLGLICACGSGDQEERAEEATVQEHIHTPVVPTSEGTVKSPRKETMANVGDVHVHIDYSAPSMRGRTIWGGLVAFGDVWVTGAHRATSIEFSEDVKVEGKQVPAGKYALFTIPGEEEWTVILNTNWKQHLTDEYSASEDVARFTVTPQRLDEPREQLSYELRPVGEESADLLISWEEVQLSLTLEAV